LIIGNRRAGERSDQTVDVVLNGHTRNTSVFVGTASSTRRDDGVPDGRIETEELQLLVVYVLIRCAQHIEHNAGHVERVAVAAWMTLELDTHSETETSCHAKRADALPMIWSCFVTEVGHVSGWSMAAYLYAYGVTQLAAVGLLGTTLDL
jgi:hypothetical protein